MKKKELKLVKCIVVDNSINEGWRVGDGVEMPEGHEWIKKGFLKVVI